MTGCRTGFTLAEVLITLGIIGVVAAMTLAPLIHKYKIHQLEVAFKRSSSLIENALKKTAEEYGYNSIKDLTTICGYPGSNSEDPKTTAFKNCENDFRNIYIPEISNYFLSQFNIVKTIPGSKWMNSDIKNITFNNYSGDYSLGYYALYGFANYATPNAGYHILNDGSAITSMTFLYHEQYDGLGFTFDTNGPKKGPNRYGYDIFLYNTGSWAKWCSKVNNLSTPYNGRGCYDWALKNQNPDNKNKGYWESL